MSNRNADSAYDQLSGMMQFVLEQWRKGLNTLLPGKVVSYEPTRRRAVVEPVPVITFTDGSQQRRPPIVDVPVIWTAAGGYAFHAPLNEGDAVVLAVMQRGISRFKRAYEVESSAGDPDILSWRDAVAIPGFGTAEPITIPEDATGALVMQTEDGSEFISLHHNGDIKVKSTRTIKLEAPRIEITADNNIVAKADRIDLN